ncbi:MAG TPA: hypothetical protein VEP90_21460 [Methylomirabilota bacterium]|nr:hypothetical protein [Methylomirabilota bacterium]
MSKYNVRDTVLLSGWLFADLLLGLAIIFFVSLPGAQQPPSPIIKWTVTPTSLDPKSPECTGGLTAPRCNIILGETADSQANMSWRASSDMSSTTMFSPASSGILSPGQSVKIAISAFPCQNGSFTFTASSGILPLVVAWHCTLPQERLNFKYKEFGLTVHDINGLLSDSPSAINDIEQQVRNQPFLQQGSVGLAIVYGGTPDDAGISEAQTIASKVYRILGILGQQGFAFQRSSYYVPLYNLGPQPSQITVDVYLYQT